MATHYDEFPEKWETVIIEASEVTVNRSNSKSIRHFRGPF